MAPDRTLNPFAEVTTTRERGEIVALRIVAPVKGRGLQTSAFSCADGDERFRAVRRTILGALFDAQQGGDAWRSARARDARAAVVHGAAGRRGRAAGRGRVRLPPRRAIVAAAGRAHRSCTRRCASCRSMRPGVARADAVACVHGARAAARAHLARRARARDRRRARAGPRTADRARFLPGRPADARRRAGHRARTRSGAANARARDRGVRRPVQADRGRRRAGCRPAADPRGPAALFPRPRRRGLHHLRRRRRRSPALDPSQRSGRAPASPRGRRDRDGGGGRSSEAVVFLPADLPGRRRARRAQGSRAVRVDGVAADRFSAGARRRRRAVADLRSTPPTGRRRCASPWATR